MPISRRSLLLSSPLVAVSGAVAGNQLAANDATELPHHDSDLPGLEIVNTPVAQMLSEKVKGQLKRFYLRQAAVEAGVLRTYDDQGFRAAPDIIPRLSFHRSNVFRANRSGGEYNTSVQITKFKNRYYIAWANGLNDEEAPGQQVLIASSADGLVWSAPQPAVPRQVKENLVHCSVGLMASEHELYLFCWTEVNLHDDKAAPGMHRFDPKARRWDLYSSQDGSHWQLRTPRLLDAGSGHNAIYEAPRFTRDGVLMCGGTHNGPAVFRWLGGDPTERPEVIAVPPTPGLRFPYGEATWHQTRDGLIVMFWRDEAHSTRLYVNSSKDGGRTWTMPVITDIPNSMQRVYGGTLPDGRAYLINDACPQLLRRRQLTIALSDDGRVFDRIWMLVDDPTKYRFPGLLKVHGWQYPAAFVDGNRLLVAYNANKEDIGCGVIELQQLS